MRPCIFIFLIRHYGYHTPCKGMAREFITCKKCGKAIDAYYFSDKPQVLSKIRESELCFDCLFWQDFINNRPENIKIIDGCAWQFIPLKTPFFKYHCNRPEIKCIFSPTTKKLFHATQAKLIGRIPKLFEDELPTEYRFVSGDTYFRLQKYMCNHCRSKGCWDRYQCVWYDESITEPNGPWNRIPKNHKVGDEKCERFINKLTMYDNN